MSAESSNYRTLVGKQGRGREGGQSDAVGAGSGMGGWRLVVKRVLDLAICIASLPLLVLLGGIVALAVKLDSRGPVLYKQVRVGKGGRTFTMYKFRSMFTDAERMLSQLDALNEADGPVFKIKRDPRITRVGRFIRKSSLDELPQIINVLRGDMSIVGPRPPIPREVAMYSPHQMGRLAVTPGLTCLWQVRGRSSVSFDQWVELDLEYIRKQSITLDLSIILQTIPAVLRGTGAW